MDRKSIEDRRRKNRNNKNTSDILLRVTVHHTAVATTQPRRNLIHPIVIHYLTIKHTRTRVSISEVWSRITPKIATVSHNATGERVLVSTSAPFTLESTSCRREECIDPKNRLQLLEAATTCMAMTVRSSRPRNIGIGALPGC